jgi:uncharacterized membrane protein YkoI
MKLILLVLFVCSSLVALPSAAKNKHSLSGYKKNAQGLVVKNPQQAARIVKSRFGGKVLKVSKKQNNGRIGYKVKLIKKDGHIITVLVDAHTGRIKG